MGPPGPYPPKSRTRRFSSIPRRQDKNARTPAAGQERKNVGGRTPRTATAPPLPPPGTGLPPLLSLPRNGPAAPPPPRPVAGEEPGILESRRGQDTQVLPPPPSASPPAVGQETPPDSRSLHIPPCRRPWVRQDSDVARSAATASGTGVATGFGQIRVERSHCTHPCCRWPLAAGLVRAS